MQPSTCPSFRPDLLIGRIPLFPGVDLIDVLTETMGQQRLDIRTWAKGDDGHLRPTSTGFRLNSDQLGVLAHMISQATQLTIAEGELADPEEEAET